VARRADCNTKRMGASSSVPPRLASIEATCAAASRMVSFEYGREDWNSELCVEPKLTMLNRQRAGSARSSSCSVSRTARIAEPEDKRMRPKGSTAQQRGGD
jgi:hypothetical protein